mgnify:FL=1
MTPDLIEAWLFALKVRIGVDDPEAEQLVAALREFCERNDVTPEELLLRWEEFAELMVRKNPANGAVPNRAVESFLIHSGVNVFGEIKCVSGSAEDLIEQGERFVPRKDAL